MLAGCLGSKDDGPIVNKYGNVEPTVSFSESRENGYTNVIVNVEKMGDAEKVIVTPPTKHPTYSGDGEPYDYAGWKWEFNEPGNVTIGLLGPNGSLLISMLNSQGDVHKVKRFEW